MKTILFPLLITLTQLIPFTKLYACEDQLSREVRIQSDYPLEIEYKRELIYGEVIRNNWNTIIFQNQHKEADLYTATGSYHSGWFQVGLVVEPQTCLVLDHFEIASE